jgi:hypothetical protein
MKLPKTPKINKQQLFLEFVSVVFAVLLALLLNSWREAANRAEMTNQVKEQVLEEVRANEVSVQTASKYRSDLLQKLRENKHIVRRVSLDELPVDVNNDSELEKFVEDQLIFEVNQVIDVRIVSRAGRRLMILGDTPYRLEIEGDELLMYGQDNIQLRTAGIRRSSWEIARATGVLVDMDLALVSAMARLDAVQGNYQEVSNQALQMLYSGASGGITSVMEDMLYFENEMIRLHSEIVELIER